MKKKIMGKAEKNNYSGIEDYSPKKNRKKWGEEESYQEPREKKERRTTTSNRFVTKKTLLGIGGILAVIVLLLFFFPPFFTNDKDTPENQLYKVIKAHTNRDYKLPGGKRLKGKELWNKLGEIDADKYEIMTGLSQQDFADDIIAVCNKAIAQESVKIGSKNHNTKDVSSDTVTAWINKMQGDGGVGDRLWETFSADSQPAFIPAYDGITLSQLALIAIVFFVLICIFFPKKLFTFDLFSDKIPMANSVKKIFEEKKH